MKIVDGFVWKLITHDQAVDLFQDNTFDVYVLYDDDSEAAVTSITELLDLLEHHPETQFGIEVGHLTKEEDNGANTNFKT